MSPTPHQTYLEERLNAARGLGWDASEPAAAAGLWQEAAAYLAGLLRSLRFAA